MDKKYLRKVYGEGEYGFANTPKKITIRRNWIIKTYGWRVGEWFTCYCPMCEGYGVKEGLKPKSWKHYRKTQYKNVIKYENKGNGKQRYAETKNCKCRDEC